MPISMFRFFRKIRKSILQNGNTSRYLKYAFGELLLVVLGILIALQINNWNESRKLRLKEITLLKEMKINLEQDIEDFEFNVRANEERLYVNETILKVLEDSLPFHDSLKYHYANLLGSTQLTENSSAYDNLKSIGFDLIVNDSLRLEITRLYSNRYEYLKSLESDLDNNFQLNRLHPVLLETMITESFWESAKPVNHEELIHNNYFKEVLISNISFRKYMLKMYVEIENQVQDLVNNIQKEIDSRD